MKLKYDINYLSTKEVADQWGVSTRTVAKYCRNGELTKVFKDPKTHVWKIPENTVKPLSKAEIKEVLLIIFKIHNYFVVDESYVIKIINELPKISPALKYLESKGYITFKDNFEDINHAVVTGKGYSVLCSGIQITIEVSSTIDLISSVVRFIAVVSS
jgi:hypothetical protein